MELNATNNALVRSYVWGLDLSGTLDGAGGVGGLLWVNQHSGPSAGAHFCAYDGNGNIVALIAAADGAETTRYEYGPFGEPVRVSGPLAKSNPFRFSTKRTDNTTDLVLYEYRAYSPSTGRWPNRDPIGERGGENLYGFVENAPVNKTDLLGRETVGAAYQSDGGLGHAALEVGGKGYGFGPKELRLFFSIGTTSGWEATAKPRTVWDLSIRKTGKFKDKLGGKCCDATLERIIQCADHFKTTWEGTRYGAFRNCRHYVDTVISSCCLSRGSARHELNDEPEEGGTQ
ncbi:RHS repeat-associated core domain-containing protein [Limisphaera sp. VF-2]|uniref:RHS repeat-associated core domain-containing protein n=1 Tax=Limisphaera sp. VF-2 TaxID=3400418 RepID=UPI003C1998A9